MLSALRRPRPFSFQLTLSRSLAVQHSNAMAESSAPRKITDWVDPKDKSGEFKRSNSQFRDFVSREKGAKFPAEKDRYHLYVSYACPWAHRVLIVRKLKGLEDILPYTTVHWHMLDKGWRFATPEDDDAPRATAEPLYGLQYLQELYLKANKDYNGRWTVPVLWDKKQQTIVSNESSEIIRMLYTEFDDLLPEKYRNIVLYPEDLRQKIDESNEWTYNDINNGVYKTGFAVNKEAYAKAIVPLFNALDRVEEHLRTSEGPYYYGKNITEADVRLYTTIVRFDPIYVQHFKTNIRDIRSGYPYLHKWLRHLYWNNDAFGPETTQFDHIRKHYSQSHSQVNPFGITPIGPLPNIMKEDEEVPAVQFALANAKR